MDGRSVRLLADDLVDVDDELLAVNAHDASGVALVVTTSDVTSSSILKDSNYVTKLNCYVIICTRGQNTGRYSKTVRDLNITEQLYL